MQLGLTILPATQGRPLMSSIGCPVMRVGRILDRGEAGEIAAALRGGRQRGLRRSRLRPVLQALIVAEGEQPVLLDRTAAGAAELILPRLRAARLEETARIQFVVAQELPEGAVKLIRSRFGCDRDLTARIVPILRREISRSECGSPARRRAGACSRPWFGRSE